MRRRNLGSAKTGREYCNGSSIHAQAYRDGAGSRDRLRRRFRPTTEEMPLKPKPPNLLALRRREKESSKTAADIEREEAEARAAAEAEALAIAQAEEAERQAALEAIRQAELAAVRAALARSAERQRSREAQAEAKSKVQQEQAESFSPIPSSRRSARGSPRLKLGKLRHADVGWVTLAANGESLVSKRTAQLPPHASAAPSALDATLPSVRA